MNRYTPEQRSAFAADWNAGVPIDQLADRLGIKVRSAYTLRFRWQLPERVQVIDDRDIRRLIARGKAIKEISEHLGILYRSAQSAVRRIRKKEEQRANRQSATGRSDRPRDNQQGEEPAESAPSVCHGALTWSGPAETPV